MFFGRAATLSQRGGPAAGGPVARQWPGEPAAASEKISVLACQAYRDGPAKGGLAGPCFEFPAVSAGQGGLGDAEG